MCDLCENPLKWKIDEDDHLVVPMLDCLELSPKIEGWEPYWVNVNKDGWDEYGGATRIVKYRQSTKAYFVCAYNEQRLYGGPEEGGWGYNERTFLGIALVAIDRKFAEVECRNLNNLARVYDLAPKSYMWGTSGVMFSVDRWPGEDDTTMDPRPHYC